MVRAIHGPWAIIQAVAATDNGDQTLTTCSDHGFCIRFLKEFGVRALPPKDTAVCPFSLHADKRLSRTYYSDVSSYSRVYCRTSAGDHNQV